MDEYVKEFNWVSKEYGNYKNISTISNSDELIEFTYTYRDRKLGRALYFSVGASTDNMDWLANVKGRKFCSPTIELVSMIRSDEEVNGISNKLTNEEILQTINERIKC